MSVEEAVTDALNAPVEQNAAAAEDAKRILAELEQEDAQPVADEPTKPNSSDSKPTDAQGEEEAKDQEPKQRDRRREGGHRPSRGGGRGGKFKRDGGIKSVVLSEEKSDDPVAIRKQVEFYFSDSNLPMDKFLFEKVGGSENNAVELSIIRTFKRMRHFEPLEAVIAALKDSKTLRLVEDDTKVQRVEPLLTDAGNSNEHENLRVFEDKAMPRSVYVKGFGEEVPSTQFDIEAFFAEFGSTNAIRLRRAEDKAFKGSVFTEFETQELAETFLALDPKPKFKGRDLQIMSKKEYCDKKVEDIKAGRVQPGRDRGFNPKDSRRGTGRGRGGKFGNNRDRREGDDRDWRTRREEDKKNGFRDDKRRDNRDKRGGRERQHSIEKDDRGIPVIKTKETDREQQKADAIAKARAVVESSEKENGATNEELSKKRDRDVEADATEAPPTKKVDVKAEA